jgi:hypothetical protein
LPPHEISFASHIHGLRISGAGHKASVNPSIVQNMISLSVKKINILNKNFQYFHQK